ncbi:MAG: hypothetical protein U0Y10_24185 [Spirosomataceae bacterium]
MKTKLHKLVKSYHTTVNHTEIVNFRNFDERLSAVDVCALKHFHLLVILYFCLNSRNSISGGKPQQHGKGL